MGKFINIISFNKSLLEEFRAELRNNNFCESGGAGQIIVSDKSGIYIDDHFLLKDEPGFEEDISVYGQLLGADNYEGLVGYTISYTDMDLASRVLQCIAQRNDIVVDNDHGKILKGQDFLLYLNGEANR